MPRQLIALSWLLLMLLTLGGPGRPVSASTQTVPTQFATIQEAINASQDGDTVLIADGTYYGPGNVDLDFGGRNITVTSQNGPAKTVIYCGGSSTANHRGFYLHSGETTAVISGLTIQQGYELYVSGGDFANRYGGGILIDQAGATIQNCIFDRNYASIEGGGICTFNFYADHTVTISQCLFTGNDAFGSNGSTGSGGGIENVINLGTVLVTNCTFIGNQALSGAGIDNENGGGEIAVTNCLFTSNFAFNDGGGIFSRNYSNTGGQSPILLTNCTLSGNQATNGGGVYNYSQTNSIVLTNCLLHGDTNGEIGKDPNSTYDATVAYCDVQGGVAGTGNLDIDPLFVSASSDFHLLPISPCLGMGTATGAPLTTLDARTRPNPPSIGAYEAVILGTHVSITTLTSGYNPSTVGQKVTFTARQGGGVGVITFTVDGSPPKNVALSNGLATDTVLFSVLGPHTVTAVYSGDSLYAAGKPVSLTQTVNPHRTSQYVSPAGSDSNPGTQAAPWLTIQAAINACIDGDSVFVADGTYTGPGNVDLDFGGNNLTVTSLNGAAKTIIDCGGSSTANHRGFYLHRGETNAVIRGLTIQNGYEDIFNSAIEGGGIWNVGVGVTIQNCIFRNNASEYGGGLANTDCGPITVTNCLFIGNSGGINNTSSAGSPFHVTNCTFTGNRFYNGQGAIYNYMPNAMMTLTNDICYGDTPDIYGNPGMEVSNYSAVVAVNCDVQGGLAGTGNFDADPQFFNAPLDLHLQPGSPCRGVGTAAGAPATTLDDLQRPTPPSVGAYEAIAPGTSVATIITLASSSNPAFVGQSVTFYANLTASGRTPTGAITFMIDGAAVTPVTQSSGYSASYTTSTLPVGSHTVTAAYSGDSTFAPSVSAVLTQKIIAHISPQYVSPSGNDDNTGTQSSPKLTIQAAVNATQSGDTVIVGDGTYTGPGNVDVLFAGRNLTVTSQNGAAKTIIDCGGSSSANHRGFYLDIFETNDVLSGLTIENGYEGGSGSSSDNNGGAIYNRAISLTVQNCIFKNNTVTQNNGDGNGGGIYNSVQYNQSNAALTLLNCTFLGNNATYGGGVATQYGSVGRTTLTNCVFTGNTATNGGGGFSDYIPYTGPTTLTNCVFTGNSATNGSGGGLAVGNNGGTATLTNCVFTGNTAPKGTGGGIDSFTTYSGLFQMVNCTLTANTATAGGGFSEGGLGTSSSITFTLTNDILYGNTGGDLSTGDLGTVTYCDLLYYYAGTGNISADPQFYNAPTDLRLQASSPCLGAGTAAGAPAMTINGETRPTPPSIGAYEAAFTGKAVATTTVTSSLNPSVYGQSVTFTISVAGQGLTPTGAVTVMIDGATQAHLTLNGGTATYSPSLLYSGFHAITATYTGDATYAPSKSALLPQTVQAIPSTTTLVSSPNPSAYGQSVTFTVTVSGSLSPTGLVTLTDQTSGTNLVLLTLSNGTVTYFTSALSGGSHQIVATYGGDGRSGGSSAAVTQVVTKGTTGITISSRLSPTLFSQTVTFSVSLTNSGGGTPTGTVTVTIDGVAQPPVPLSNGYYAAYSTSSLSVGSHTVTATYNGDASFASSTSAPITQTVLVHIAPQYVSPSGSDSNPGTSALPKLTIQAAVNATVTGDTVIVEDGTYTGPGDVDVIFSGRNLTMTSLNGPTKTVIDCGGSALNNHRAFLINNGETNVVFSGLTIENGYEGGAGFAGFGSAGGAILLNGSGLTLQNCILKNNTAANGSGGGIYSYSSYPLVVTNTVFVSNSANSGGGLYADTNLGPITVTNCTFTGNAASPSYGGGLYVYNIGYPPGSSPAAITLANDIFYGDTGGEFGTYNITLSANNCDIQGGYAGIGNFDADPLFVGTPANLHLLPISPCLGAGTSAGAPATDLDGYTRHNPPSVGAYEASPMVPLPPTNLKASAGNGSVALSWTGSAGATTYTVYRATTSGAEALVQSGLATATYTDASVSLGQTYFYQVTASNSGGGESPLSAEASAAPGYPLPTIAALSPGSAPVNASSVLLKLTGRQFVPGVSVVHWKVNGQDTSLVTVCTSATQATATVPGALLHTAETAQITVQITVVNPAPGGGESSPVSFTVGTPHLTVTLSMFRNSLNQVGGTLTVHNTGTIDLNNVFMHSSSLGRSIGIARPAMFGSLAAGATKTTLVFYPSFSSVSGTSASLRLVVTYDGGSVALNTYVFAP